jgi:hypothetical protein
MKDKKQEKVRQQGNREKERENRKVGFSRVFTAL